MKMIEREKMNKNTLTSRDLQAIERKNQLLMAAKKLFSTYGYHATSVRQIMSEVQMADGLIYHYFPKGKKQILDEICLGFVKERFLDLPEDLNKINATMPMREILLAFGHLMFKYIGNDKESLMIFFREQQLLDESYLMMLKKTIKNVLHYTVRLLRKKSLCHEIPKLNFYLMANQFWSPLYAYSVQNLLFSKKIFYDIEPEEYLEKIVSYTLATWQVK